LSSGNGGPAADLATDKEVVHEGQLAGDAREDMADSEKVEAMVLVQGNVHRRHAKDLIVT
jgi:hypothetical protein